MKIVLSGAKGMLGHAIKEHFSDVPVVCLPREALDITVLDDVVRKVKEARPDCIINAAAFTDVDACETEPEKAYLVNGIGVRNLAIASEELNCPIVHISSDYVFDGTKQGPYDEWDDTNPVSKYGISKLLGERFIMSLTNRFYIIRTSWLYGPNGRNFVSTILRLLQEKERVSVVTDQVGSPTFTRDLAAKIREIIGRGYGIYHVTNSGSCSWYEFAKAIAAKRGVATPIDPVTSEQFRRPAKRPANSVLGNTMLRLEGLEPLRPWREALEEYLGS
jgi:dTDP-4-dehydrorhamnose reductase